MSDNPLMHMAAILIEETKRIGTPLRSTWLYSTGLVMVIEVNENLQPKFVWSSNDRNMALPAFVTITGPNGMSVNKLLPEAPDQLVKVIVN
jgi:hypothetical protein